MARMTTKTKRRLVILAILIVAAGAGYYGLRQFRKAQASRLADERRDEGMAAYLSGDYDTALQPLSYALSKRKDDVELLIAFADTRSKVPDENFRHIVEAVNLYNEALRLDPDNREAMQRLLDLYESARVGEIRDYFDTATALLKLEPDHLQARAAVARYHQSQRQFDQAIEALLRLQELEPDNIEWRLRHLEAFAGAGATESEQLDLCDQWIAESESDGRMLFVRAVMLRELGRIDEARAAARDAAERRIDSPDVHHGLVMLLDDLDLPSDADALVQRAKEQFPAESWVWDEAIRRPWLRRDLDAALAELELAKATMNAPAPNLLKWDVLINILMDRPDEMQAALRVLRERAETVEDRESRDSLRAWGTALAAYADLRRSEWRDVRASFEDAIALAPGDPVLHYILGDAYREVTEFDLAADAYAAAWRLEPEWVAAGIAYGETLLQLGRPHQAMQVATDMGLRGDRIDAAIVPLFVRSWLSTCRAFGSVDHVMRLTGVTLLQVTETLERFRASVDMNESPDLVMMLYDAYRLEGNADGARSLTDDILDMGDDATTMLLLTAAQGSALANLGLEDELIRRAETRDERWQDIAGVKAWLARRDGDVDGGLRMIEQAREAASAEPDFDPEAWDRMRALHFAAAGDERAAPEFADLLSAYPDSPDLPGVILSHRAAWSDQDLIERAINMQQDIVGDRGSTRLLLAEASYTLLFNPDDKPAIAEAIDKIRRALEMSDTSLAGLTLMADALLATEPPQYRDAIDYLERALQTYPARVDLYARIISLCQDINDYSTAAEWLEKLAQRNDLNERMQDVELVLLDQQGDWNRAIERLTSRGDAHEPSEMLALASLYVRTGQFDEAERLVDELLAAPEHNEMAVRFAAELYVMTDRVDDAVALLHDRPVDGGPGAGHARLGTLYRRAGMLDESIAALEPAVDAEPDNPDFWNELATTYLQARRYAEARRAAKTGLALEPDHSTLLANYALACLDAPKSTREEAIAMLDAGDPDHAALIDTIRLYSALDGGQPDAEDLRDAAALVRKHPDFLPGVRLAVNLHVSAGDLRRALTLAEDAINRFPNDPPRVNGRRTLRCAWRTC